MIIAATKLRIFGAAVILPVILSAAALFPGISVTNLARDRSIVTRLSA
jgi:hypothetical protein